MGFSGEYTRNTPILKNLVSAEQAPIKSYWRHSTSREEPTSFPHSYTKNWTCFSVLWCSQKLDPSPHIAYSELVDMKLPPASHCLVDCFGNLLAFWMWVLWRSAFGKGFIPLLTLPNYRNISVSCIWGVTKNLFSWRESVVCVEVMLPYRMNELVFVLQMTCDDYFYGCQRNLTLMMKWNAFYISHVYRKSIYRMINTSWLVWRDEQERRILVAEKVKTAWTGLNYMSK